MAGELGTPQEAPNIAQERSGSACVDTEHPQALGQLLPALLLGVVLTLSAWAVGRTDCRDFPHEEPTQGVQTGTPGVISYLFCPTPGPGLTRQGSGSRVASGTFFLPDSGRK